MIEGVRPVKWPHWCFNWSLCVLFRVENSIISYYLVSHICQLAIASFAVFDIAGSTVLPLIFDSTLQLTKGRGYKVTVFERPASRCIWSCLGLIFPRICLTVIFTRIQHCYQGESCFEVSTQRLCMQQSIGVCVGGVTRSKNYNNLT